MDLNEALTDTEYAIKWRGLILYFTLRDPTNAEDLDYRRRSAKTNIKKNQIESSDTALDAPLWLLEKLKTKCEYSNGEIVPETGETKRQAVPDELYRKIPARTKLSVIVRHLSDMEGEETEKN